MSNKCKVEIVCYNCFGDENKECQLCNGTKKIKVTKNFAKIMGYGALYVNKQ